MAFAIATVFGSKQIQDIVTNFDFKKMDVSDSTRDDYLTVKLAPSFGTLNSETIKTLDSKLKIMMAATTRVISKIPPEERSWDKIVSAMTQNPLLEPADDGVMRADKFLRNEANFFKFDGSPSLDIVQTWFVNFIQDEDVLKGTSINIDVLAQIVAQTGAVVTSFETAVVKKESHEKTLVDIGVLRYPDLDNPFLKVYRVKLVAWSHSFRILGFQKDENGITGEFAVRRFKPREAVIAQMKADVMQSAVSEAENMFA